MQVTNTCNKFLDKFMAIPKKTLEEDSTKILSAKSACYEEIFEWVIDKILFNFSDTCEIVPQILSTIVVGDYQGDLIIIFTIDKYSPCIGETYYTTISYGSCTVCDTLQNIFTLEPDERFQPFYYLCLDMVRNIRGFKPELSSMFEA